MTIRNGEQYLKVWDVEQDGNRVRVNISTTRKEFWAKGIEQAVADGAEVYNQKSDASYKPNAEFVYVESNWGKYNYLVGDAAKLAPELLAQGEANGTTKWGFKKPVTIKVPVGQLELKQEPYMKDGNKVYPKPTVTIFDCELVTYGNSTPTPAPDVDEDEFPF